MCDVCSGKGVNWSLACGQKRRGLKTGRLYSLKEGHVVKIKLCYLCDIKLFTKGEAEFLRLNLKHIDFRFDSSSSDDEDIFG